MAYISGLSGNELYCLAQKNYQPHNLIMGNNIYSLGWRGTIGSDERGMLGLEIKELTQRLKEGRNLAFERMLQTQSENSAIIGIHSKLIFHPHTVEFIVSGNQIQYQRDSAMGFSTHCNGQELFAMLDAEYQPNSFVLENIVYSTGMTGGLIGKLKNYARGEVTKLSEKFNAMRNLPLERMIEQGRKKQANAILGISLQTTPYSGVNEIITLGTAVTHPALSPNEFYTSHLSCVETWNLVKLGYIPMRLLIKSAIYSTGLMNNMAAALKSKENPEHTKWIYHIRNSILKEINQESQKVGAEYVIGIKTQVYQLGNGLIEFLSYGTAIKKMSGIKTISAQLPNQALAY